MSSPCTPDVVGETFTPGGVFDDADDEWDGLPITPADQQSEALATPDSDGWRSASCICSQKSTASSRTAFTGMTAASNATVTLASSTSKDGETAWPHHCRMGSQDKHVLADDAKQDLDLISCHDSVITEMILGNVGSHEKVEADEKLRTDSSNLVPEFLHQPVATVNVNKCGLEDGDAGDEIIIVSTPPSDMEVDAAEIARAKRVVISKAQASAHDNSQSSDGGKFAPTETFGGDMHHDVKSGHSTFHCDHQPSQEVCDVVTPSVTRDISTPASDDFPAASSFLPANFFDDDLDTVDSGLLRTNPSPANVKKPVVNTLEPADTPVGPALLGHKSMKTVHKGDASSAWQLDFTHGSTDPIPELVNLSPAAAALFKVLGIATEPPEEEAIFGGKAPAAPLPDLATEANVASSPISSTHSSEEDNCSPSFSSIHSSCASTDAVNGRGVAPTTQPATSSIAVTAVDESLLFTDASFTTGRSELVSQSQSVPHHLSAVTADSDFRHLLGHWLAAYVIGRLAHRERVGTGNIAAEWTRHAVHAREIERIEQVANPQLEYSFFNPRPTPRAIDRTSGRFAEDPYGVLKRHGIVSAAPNMAFVQIVTEFIVRRRIPAETIVAAAWFVDNLPVHEVDGELGFHLRGSLCTSNGEPFAIERRLAMVALYLADMSISDFNYNLASWSNAFGVPKANAVRIEREALASLGYSVSIPIQSWRDHCKNVYSLFTRATFLPGVSTLSLGTMHTVVLTARGAAEEASSDVESFLYRQATIQESDAVSSLRRLQSTIDTSQMPVPATVTRVHSNSVYHTPASNQENVAPPMSWELEDEDEFAPYDGAPTFPAPVFPKQVAPAASALPTPPYDGADSFPEPVFENDYEQDVYQEVARFNAQSPKAKVADWLHSEQEDEDENTYEEYDGAAPFPDPVPLEPKAPKYSMSIQVEASSLARSPHSHQSHAPAPKRARYASSPRHNPAASWPSDTNPSNVPTQQQPPMLQQRMSYAALSRGYSSYYPQDQLQLPKSLSAQPKFFSSEVPHYLTREQLRSLAVEHHPRPVRAPYINGVAINHGRVDALEAAIEQCNNNNKNYAHGYPTDNTYGLASEALLPTLITALINAAAELEPLKEAPEPVTSAAHHRSSMATVA